MNNIPKIFFSYWDGSSMTFLQYLTIISFKELNPDWKIIIYMPENKYEPITWKSTEQKYKIEHKDYLKELNNLNIEIIKINFEEIEFFNDVSEVYKSDYLRYYMLNKHGGLWSDMDIIYIKPIEYIFNKNYTIYGNFENIDTIITYQGYYSIGILMSSPNNFFYKDLTNNCKLFFNKLSYQSIGVLMIKKLYPNPSIIKEKHSTLNVLILNNTCYLPFQWNRISDIFIKYMPDNIKPHTIGIHWFNGSSLSKQYQKLIENNQLSSNCSIYPYIEKYLQSFVNT